MSRFRPRQMDGVGRQPIPARVPPPARPRYLLAVASLVVIAMSVAVSAWAAPLFAAMPGHPSWVDRLALLALAQPSRYLILFQNNHELRPTGGFIGSFAEVETGWGGAIRSVRVETNIYGRDARFAPQLAVTPPEPLREFLGSQPWALRDANWAIDFPTAAQEVAWFYANEGGQAVDGVIAVDTRLLERLLRLTGPLTMPADGTPITSDNVVAALQEEIEHGYWEQPENRLENQPKSILAELLPQLVGKLTQQAPSALVTLAAEAAHEKELLIFHRHPRLAALLSQMNWAGHIQHTAGDYLLINEANLTPVDGTTRVVGAKSSYSIDQTATLVRTPAANGRLHHHLTLSRTHRGQMAWPDGPNDSFLRLAVPADANLIGAWRNTAPIDAEIRQSTEAGKMVYGAWSRLVPGQSETLIFEYDTPQYADGAPLLIQRQPGAPAWRLTVRDGSQLRWDGRITHDQLVD